MNNRKPLYLTIAIGLIIVVALLAWLFRSPSSETTNSGEEVRGGVSGEPIDITLDFFDKWLLARQSSTTDPYSEKLTTQPALAASVGEKLAQGEAAFKETGFDPVLCQTELPEGFRAKPVFENDTEAQYLVMTKDKKPGVQTIVSLKAQNNLWLITDITCGTGEQAPEQGEFSFNQEGFLLKEHVPAPLDSKYWHLVFTQNGVQGYTAPLLFSDTSVCMTETSAANTCDDASLGETMKVLVQGNMTEAGVDVVKLQLVTE